MQTDTIKHQREQYNAQITQIVRFIEFGEENMAACKRRKRAYIAANKHLCIHPDQKVRAQYEADVRKFHHDQQLITEGIELGARELARIRAERSRKNC